MIGAEEKRLMDVWQPLLVNGAFDLLHSHEEPVGFFDLSAEYPMFRSYKGPRGCVTSDTCFDRDQNRETWIELMEFLIKLPPTRDLSILVTAMSFGCDLYDGVRIAREFNLFVHHPGAIFYGHDKETLSTQRACEAIYPRAKTCHVPAEKNMFSEIGMERFVGINPDIRQHTRILAPCDIADLQGRFDIVVCNRINPTPPELGKDFRRLARHLAMDENNTFGLSPKYIDCYEKSSPQERRYSILQKREYDYEILPGSEVSVEIPVLFTV